MPGKLSDEQILIAGAGIGGLSAAVSLAHHGISSHIVERSKSFSTDGAGIQLGPNATRILKKWGVLERLTPNAVVCEEILIGDGLTGESLASIEFGKTAQQRYGGPFLLVHRADLHQALLETAKKFGIKITLDCEARSFAPFPDKITLRTMAGEMNGRALIAADGLWSIFRQQIDGEAVLRYAGKSAWRTLLDRDQLPVDLQGPRTGVWLSGNVHLVHYPVLGGKKINLVAVVDERAGGRGEGWSQEAEPEYLMPAFANWDKRITKFVSCGGPWRKWSLFHLPPLRSWTQGRVTLLGDAAHPMLPFLAQGGAMAIEDAFILGRILAAHEDDPGGAFRQFETARIERTARTAFESRRMGNIYHMSGVFRLARNFVLRRSSPRSMLKKLDWLYQNNAGR